LFLEVVQLLIPVRQRLQTDVSREAFIADLTALDKFKDGIVAQLGSSPRGVPYSRDNVVIDSITAVAARRSLHQLQGSAAAGYSDAGEKEKQQRQLAAGGTLEISYWISLIEQNVKTDVYTSSPAFAAHFAAIVASLASPAMRSSIEAFLATSSTNIMVTALAPDVASSTSQIIVVVLQGPPTPAPSTSAAAASAEKEVIGAEIAIYISVSVLVSAAAALVAYRKKWGRGQSKVGVAVEPPSQDESGTKLVGTLHAVSPHSASAAVGKAPSGSHSHGHGHGRKFGRGHGNGHRNKAGKEGAGRGGSSSSSDYAREEVREPDATTML
jgi:hypothetical protein